MNKTQILYARGSEVAASIVRREYNRMLQLPRERDLEGPMLERAEGAKKWYGLHGNPFVAARRVDLLPIVSQDQQNVEIREAGIAFHSAALARRLYAGQAHALMLVAASAGLEVADEVARLWKAGLPDEAYFLDRFAVAVAERLLLWTSATLCRTSEPTKETLMPHLSPGCGSWDLGDQHKVWLLLAGERTQLGPLRLLESGALHPQHSVIAAMGVTHRHFSTTLDQLCRSCDLAPCSFRRAPFSGDTIGILTSQEMK